MRHSWERGLCLTLVVTGVCVLMWWLVSRIWCGFRRRGGGCLLLLGWGAYQLGGPPDLVEPGLDPGAGVVEP